MDTTRPRPESRRLPALAAACAFVGIGMVGSAAAGLPAQDRVPQRSVERPHEFVTGQDDNLFSLARSQEDIHAWSTALAELAAGKPAAATERLHKLLQEESHGVVPVAPGRFLGLRLAAVLTLANLPPAAVEEYEKLVRREAGALANRPLHELGTDQLLLLADRYPAAAAGLAARKRLGDLALEAGRPLEAASHFRAAIDGSRIGSAEEKALYERLLCAGVMLHPRSYRDLPQQPEAVGDVLSVLPAASDANGWTAVGGGGDGAMPMTQPAGRPTAQWNEDVGAPGFDRRDAGAFAMHAVGDLEGLFVNTGAEVIAFEPLRGEVAWMSPSPIEGSIAEYDETINQDMVLAPSYGGDVVVAALQVPENSTNVEFQGHFRILHKIPERRLFAFSRTTGKLLWAHFDQVEGPLTRRFRGHSSCGPPLVLGDTVYAPVHDRSGAIAFAVAAYDLHTGQPKWRRLVCSSQQDVNMFGNSRMEFASSPLCARDGILFGSSNLGVAFAVDFARGDVRWITAYDVVRMPQAQLHGQMDRPVYFANSAPAVADGVLCVTPLDSQFALAFDVENGARLWQLPYDAMLAGAVNEVRWLCGAMGDEFVLAGRGAVAVKARPARLGEPRRAEARQLVRPEALARDREPTPRPGVTPNEVWIPSVGKLAAFDRNGNYAPGGEATMTRLPGNLLLVDGLVVSLRQRALEVLFDPQALLQRAEERLQQNPDDPQAILRLATLKRALATGVDERNAVAVLYRRGLEASRKKGLPPTHPVRRALQSELFALALAEATRAIEERPAEAEALLAAARDAAPDTASLLEAQTLLIGRLGDRPQELRAELERMERLAGDAPHAFLEGTMPVAAWAAWRKAQLPDLEPEAAVAAWQDLLERFPQVVIAQRPAADRAQAEITALVKEHGESVYAAVAARADAALAKAGEDPALLSALVARYPASKAATAAGTRLLDLAVARGDLGAAVEVLAHALRSGEPGPGVLRRVLAAAVHRGNRSLAAAMAARLRPHAAVESDWPADQGATYGEVLRSLEAGLAERSAPEKPVVPEKLVARIPSRNASETWRLLPVLHATGFAVPPARPLYALQSTKLTAIDLDAPGSEKTALFQLPVKYLDHLLLCGETLVVPDHDRVFAVHHRTGQLLWELPNPKRQIYDCIGVQSGVLHLCGRTADASEGAQFVGLEPTTGKQLFLRPLPADRGKATPKAAGGHVLLLEAPSVGDPVVHRVDPVTGRTLASVRLKPDVLLQKLGLPVDSVREAGLFAQGLCADAERIYVPVDAMLTGGPPRVLALDGSTGEVAWRWEGGRERRLADNMVALRGDALVVVEGSEDRGGRVLVLDAKTGAVRRELDLGNDVDVLNWQRSWLQSEAPRALVLADHSNETRGANERRVTCFAVDEGLPSFRVALAADDGECDRQPIFGDDFLAFCVRPARTGPSKLYALKLADRSGAMPNQRKYQRLPPGPTFGVAAVGIYTVVSAADELLVYGDGRAR